jgi:hypothetical protein
MYHFHGAASDALAHHRCLHNMNAAITEERRANRVRLIRLPRFITAA